MRWTEKVSEIQILNKFFLFNGLLAVHKFRFRNINIESKEEFKIIDHWWDIVKIVNFDWQNKQ